MTPIEFVETVARMETESEMEAREVEDITSDSLATMNSLILLARKIAKAQEPTDR